jgi:Tol biopolymer transport system component
VAYDSVARNLDSNLANDCPRSLGDCNRKQDVFIHDLTTGANVLISKTHDGLRSGNGTATAPIISADGTKVIYQSNDDDLTCASPPCTGEAAKYWNIYSYDIATGVNSLLTPGENGDSKFPWPSSSGASVAFYSTATNLVTSPAASGTQVYEWAASGITLVSHSQLGSGGAVVAGNGVSQLPMMSADGSTIVYDTVASNITSSTMRQAVAYKTQSGQNTVVSACGANCANGGTPGAPGNHPSFVVYSDASGARIAFVSGATNISMTAPSTGKKSLFVWSPTTGPVWEDVGNAYISGPAIGAGGTTVAWTQSLTNGFNQPTGRVYAMVVP